MVRSKSDFSALQVASKIARETNLADVSRTEFARQIHEACGGTKAAAKRAAETVLTVRLARRGNAKSRNGRRNTAKVTLAERLAAWRARKVEEAFRRAGYRKSTHYDGLTVSLGDPSFARQTSEGWIDYKRAGRWHGIDGQSDRLVVRSTWTRDVYARDLEILDGLFTLDLQATDQAGVYAAAWLRQGRGTSVEVERGFIAIHEAGGRTIAYHAKDASGATRGLKRKLTAQGVPQEVRDARRAARIERKKQQVTGLLQRFAKYDLGELANVELVREDSLRAGNCEPGTDDFIERFAGGRKVATVAELMASADLRDLSSVSLEQARQFAAAVLVAIRRNRRARRLVTA